MQFGIDLGGTKIEAILLDSLGNKHWGKRIDTPQGDYQAILNSIHNLHREAETQAGTQLKLGIGTPGTLSAHNGLLKNSNSTCLNGKPLRDDLQNRLQRPVRISNDANCFALSEATDGTGSNAAVVFGVIIGTGTGAGIVINKQILEGRHGIGGEWGHNPLPWPRDEERPGNLCYCGKHGCLETFLSGPGLQKLFHQISGTTLDSKAIVALAEQENPIAEKLLRDYEDRLARGLAHVINIIDPDMIILGGGMGNIQRLYENVPLLLANYVFSDIVQTPLCPPRFGDASGVRGAAWLWPRE